ncbi:hypothetical protein EVAR_91400_1 [Eumeta japonica]|uniref:Uncharacterized protein n=1 Tax=Eumeta variegata TaxID=151549 RepID=A0A4C1XDV2_EUMVA|nr:hypothetical protein EVAR_91400_1 [Eumeta japonica]
MLSEAPKIKNEDRKRKNKDTLERVCGGGTRATPSAKRTTLGRFAGVETTSLRHMRMEFRVACPVSRSASCLVNGRAESKARSEQKLINGILIERQQKRDRVSEGEKNRQQQAQGRNAEQESDLDILVA